VLGDEGVGFFCACWTLPVAGEFALLPGATAWRVDGCIFFPSATARGNSWLGTCHRHGTLTLEGTLTAALLARQVEKGAKAIRFSPYLDRRLNLVLRPLSYLGAVRSLMLPLSRLLPYLYLPDRSTAYTGLTSAVAAISMLSSYRPNTSTSVRIMPTFLFCLAFPRLSNHSLASCYESSPVFLVRVSQFFVYLLRLFCYLLSTILRISQPFLSC
jgi:hypothetical protein